MACMQHVTTRRSLPCRLLLPFCFLFSVIASVDRANLGFASLDLTAEIGLSPPDYGLGAGIFFLSYSLFQVSAITLAPFYVDQWFAVIVRAQRARACTAGCGAVCFWSRHSVGHATQGRAGYSVASAAATHSHVARDRDVQDKTCCSSYQCLCIFSYITS
jgi:hypothetical protein